MIKEKYNESAEYIHNIIGLDVQIACVLGTGMSSLENLVSNKIEIPYEDIPYFPLSSVESHSGKIVAGKIGSKGVILLAGRFHYYEGYDMETITYYVHVLKSLGVQKMILTNAAGGLNPHFKEGDLVLVTDHINLFPVNPLRGQNDDEYGPRFPDMLYAYDRDLQTLAHKYSDRLSIPLKTGVYLGWQGPSLETPAEYKMARILGADLVGMSTVPEVIVAKYCGIKVAVFSIVSNACFPISNLKETTIDYVIDVVNKSAAKLITLISKMIID